MYAVFQDGGKQYRVQEGDEVLVETRELAEGQNTLDFPTVLMIGDGGKSKLGAPYLKGVVVKSSIVREFQMPKVTGWKHRRRKGYLRRFGHRQHMIRVRITGIAG